MGTPAPDQKHFSPSYTLRSQPILGSSRKKKITWIKSNMEFPAVIKKNHVKFLGILVLGLKISEGCNTILWSFWGPSFVLSGIFMSKVKTLKVPGDFSKKYVLNHFGKLR